MVTTFNIRIECSNFCVASFEFLLQTQHNSRNLSVKLFKTVLVSSKYDRDRESKVQQRKFYLVNTMIDPTEVKTVPVKIPTVTNGFAVTRPPIKAVPSTELKKKSSQIGFWDSISPINLRLNTFPLLMLYIHSFYALHFSFESREFHL